MGLDALLASLQRFCWQGAGDWAAALTAGLCRAASHARPLSTLDLQYLLEEALRVRSSVDRKSVLVAHVRGQFAHVHGQPSRYAGAASARAPSGRLGQHLLEQASACPHHSDLDMHFLAHVPMSA